MPATFAVFDVNPENALGPGSLELDPDFQADSTFKAIQFEAVIRDVVNSNHTPYQTHLLKFGQLSDGASILEKSSVRYNGFVGTVLKAWKNHHKLSISPDHVWAAILQSLSRFMNDGEGSECLRDKLVHHQKGKETITVKSLSTDISTINWDLILQSFSQEIGGRVKTDIAEWMQPTFSTTGPKEMLHNCAVLMCAMQKYFDYEVECVCGIPSITLEGTPDDWKTVSQRLKTLKNFGLQEWYKCLKPILAEFVNASKGEVDKSFWQNICQEVTVHPDDDSFIYGGGKPVTYISGWINLFFPEIREKKFIFPKSNYGQIEIEDIPNAVAECPVVVNVGDGLQHTVTFHCGFIGTAILKDGKTLRPEINWVISEEANLFETRVFE